MGVGFRETLIFCHQAELVSSVLWSNNFKIFLDSFVRCLLLNTLFPIKSLYSNQFIEPPKLLYEKGVFKDFAKFTGKHLCRSLFFNNVAGLGPATSLKKKL